MTLKEKLEAIWNRPGVIHPSHRNWWIWAESEYWWEQKVGAQNKHVHCLKGARTQFKGKRPKGKGYSFLPKNYSLYYLHRYLK